MQFSERLKSSQMLMIRTIQKGHFTGQRELVIIKRQIITVGGAIQTHTLVRHN
jgi:hypothetical protein